MSAELVAIELQLKGYDGVMSDMRMLDTMLNNLRGRKNRLTIQSNLAKAKKDIIAYQGELNRLRQVQDRLASKGMKSEGISNKIKEITQKLKDARQAANEFQYALKNMSPMTFMQAFGKISSMVGHFGSAMQSFGNALTRLTSPFQRFTSGLIMGAGYKALNKFTEGFESAFTRSDTMRKYTRLMKEYETANYTAEQSRDELDKSVQGLPIALDDAVSLAQRYTLSLGDMERGTKLAIATNNAFLASMATENQRYQGMLQMQDLLNGKKLNSREWMSLGASMGKAINEIGKEFGYTNENMGEFRQKLYAGQISTTDFLDALQKVGTGEGSLVKLAQESMDTWEAFFSRIGTAASRFGYGIISSLDELVTTVTGGKFKSVNSLLDDQFIPAIDRMSASVQKWIKSHPDEIADFFRSLKAIDWGSIVRGMGEGILALGDIIEKVANALEGKDLSKVGKFMVMGNLWGKALTITGGLIKGTRHIWGAIGAIGLIGFLKAKGFAKFGLAGMLGQAIGGTAKGAAETATTVATTSANVGKMGRFMGGLSSIFKGWAEIATMVVGTAGVAWASVKLVKGTIKSIGEIGEEVKQVDWDAAVPALKGFGIFMGTFLSIGSALGTAGSVAMKPAAIGTAVLGGLTAMVAGFADLDMFLIKRTLKNLSKATEYLNQAVDNLNNLDAIGEVGTAKNRIKNAIITFNQIKSLFRGTWDAQRGEWSGGLDKFPKSIRKSVENISETIGNMKTAIIDLNELAGMELDTSAVEEIAPDLTEALSSLRTSILAIPKEWKEDGIVEATSNVSSSIANLKSVFDSMVGDDGILAQISGFIQQSQGYGEGGVYDALITRVQELASALLTVYTSLQGIGAGESFATNIDNFRAGLKSMKFAIQHLNAIGEMEINDNASANIDAVIEAIKNSFSQDKIEGIKTQVHNFTESIKTALQTIKDIGNEPIEVDAEVKLSSGFYSSVSSVVADINDAADDVRSAWRKIPSTLFKTIYATITAHVDTSGAVNAIEGGMNEVRNLAQNWGASLGNSTGGFISRNGSALYRAKGGSIFKPRGTDTVPAMLTPGEYVHRKQAVDYFGTDFMRRVNAMDVRGAMDALLNKASTSIGIGRQSVVNNTVNNNQRVTQNITTNNPAFASMRASRFVGAM